MDQTRKLFARAERGERAAWWAPAAEHRRSATVPLVLAGSMAISAHISAPVTAVAATAPAENTTAPALADRPPTVRESFERDGLALAAVATTATPPATYTVAPGDTVSDIAARYGLSTPQVLAANGLSWSSIIHPGQVLRLTSSTPTPTVGAPTTPAAPQSHEIVSGETVSAIAAQYGLPTDAVLAANGLGWSSLIFPGQILVIPTVESVIPAAVVAEATAALDAEQRENAQLIIALGREIGVSDEAIVVALAAAAQESSLRNLDTGDRDSVGLFQQRPSTGWGTATELTDPVHAIRLFFGGPSGPNTGTRGLLDIPGWESMSVAEAAQAVQISAHPEAYARWENFARAWFADLG